jgi:hypothetical protein
MDDWRAGILTAGEAPIPKVCIMHIKQFGKIVVSVCQWGYYTVIVSNGSGSVTSQVAELKALVAAPTT